MTYNYSNPPCIPVLSEHESFDETYNSKGHHVSYSDSDESTDTEWDNQKLLDVDEKFHSAYLVSTLHNAHEFAQAYLNAKFFLFLMSMQIFHLDIIKIFLIRFITMESLAPEYP